MKLILLQVPCVSTPSISSDVRESEGVNNYDEKELLCYFLKYEYFILMEKYLNSIMKY
jgi:hypothetical protein